MEPLSPLHETGVCGATTASWLLGTLLGVCGACGVASIGNEAIKAAAACMLSLSVAPSIEGSNDELSVEPRCGGGVLFVS